jgi:hypothetical protein
MELMGWSAPAEWHRYATMRPLIKAALDGGVHHAVGPVGLDRAKPVFQFRGVDAVDQVVSGRKLQRTQFAKFFAIFPPCVEARGTAHNGLVGAERRRLGPPCA